MRDVSGMLTQAQNWAREDALKEVASAPQTVSSEVDRLIKTVELVLIDGLREEHLKALLSFDLPAMRQAASAPSQGWQPPDVEAARALMPGGNASEFSRLNYMLADLESATHLDEEIIEVSEDEQALLTVLRDKGLPTLLRVIAEALPAPPASPSEEREP